ncbi:hypothetical protein TNCV_5042081 [Trichonephila clavipes]|uniref:Uncharacterized protein n=1 Tax=Trichonephila clavipes TaxID=2585209 RepID=A0A8X6R2Z5_TRICX|nr:hypothetical protein TNCV_5042081 [Trichonephila clavipes]
MESISFSWRSFPSSTNDSEGTLATHSIAELVRFQPVWSFALIGQLYEEQGEKLRIQNRRRTADAFAGSLRSIEMTAWSPLAKSDRTNYFSEKSFDVSCVDPTKSFQ